MADSQKKKKTVKLFWKELKQADGPQKCRFGRGTVWASLDKVAVDTARLEHLFESKGKELPVAKVSVRNTCLRSMIRAQWGFVCMSMLTRGGTLQALCHSIIKRYSMHLGSSSP